MMLTPASRLMSTCRRASVTSVLPTMEKLPRPPNVIVPMVSTEIRNPDLPSWRYSMGQTLLGRDRRSRDGSGSGRVPAGQLTVDLRVGVHPLLGAAGDLAGDLSRDADGQHAVRYHQAGRYRRARGDQGARADHGLVQHGGTVADQRLGADDAAVHHAQA